MTSTSQKQLDALDWHMMPESQGQIVEYSYAATVEGLYERRCDRSDGEVSYSFGAWRKNASEESLRFEPQNGLVALAGACKLRPIRVENDASTSASRNVRSGAFTVSLRRA